MQIGLCRLGHIDDGGCKFFDAKSFPLDAIKFFAQAKLPGAICHLLQLRHFHFQDGALFTVAIPAVGGPALPAVKNRLVLEVIISAPKNGRLFAPDQAGRKLEAGSHESAAKNHAVTGLGVGHINGTTRAQAFMHGLERGQQESFKAFRIHFVIFYLSGLAIVVDVVGRVSPDHIQRFISQQPSTIRKTGRVPAHEAMLAKMPNFAIADYGLFRWLGHIVRILVLREKFHEHLIQLLILEAGHGQIEIGQLQGAQLLQQEILIPVSPGGGAVDHDSESADLRLGHVIGQDDRHGLQSHFQGGLVAQMPVDKLPITFGKDWHAKAELFQDPDHAIDRVVILAGIFLVWTQAGKRPVFNFEVSHFYILKKFCGVISSEGCRSSQSKAAGLSQR